MRSLWTICYRPRDNLIVVAAALAVGLVPVVAPEVYRNMPSAFQLIFGSAITSTAILVFLLNLLFNELRIGRRQAGQPAGEVSAEPEPPLSGR